MQKEEITALFDQHAPSYDQKWSELAPINNALHLLAGSLLSKLPEDANILCVGAGTGAEIIYLAETFPGWRFTAVEPSAGMLKVLRARAEERGFFSRCKFHEGYLDSLQSDAFFDAATAFLVSQFIQDRTTRSEFFKSIAGHLRPDGTLISSDLAGDLSAADCRSLLDVWLHLLKGHALSSGEAEKMRESYNRDVAILPPQDVHDIITHGGFSPPVQFFQAGLIHAWFAKRIP